MDQATTSLLQQKIDCLGRGVGLPPVGLRDDQIEELTRLVRLLGFELKPIKASKPKLSIWAKRRIARAYKGISNDQVKGVTWFYRGPLCPSNHPADIAAFYAGK